jgi:transposase-like protein
LGFITLGYPRTFRSKPLRLCTICSHSKRAAINAALVGGTSIWDIAGQFGLSRSAVHRHREHVPKALAKAKQAREVAEAGTLLGRIETLIGDCRTIAEKAQKAREWHAAVSALREVRGCLELLGKLSGELQKKDSVNVSVETPLVAPVLIRQFVEMAKDGTLKVLEETLDRTTKGVNVDPYPGSSGPGN